MVMHHLEAIEIGEHDVEDHGVWAEFAPRPDRLGAAPRGLHRPALVPQHAGQEFGQAGLVVHDSTRTWVPSACWGGAAAGDGGTLLCSSGMIT